MKFMPMHRGLSIINIARFSDGGEEDTLELIKL